MEKIMRLPAVPLVVNDPYFSIWSAADVLTAKDTTHWAGDKKRLTGKLTVDGRTMRFLGLSDAPAMETQSLTVSPMLTTSTFIGAGVRLTVRFFAPLLLDDPDALSTPITYVDMSAESNDGAQHNITIHFSASDELCYDGDARPAMMADSYTLGALNIAYAGQDRQKLLCHSGDHITQDWGYLYLASTDSVCAEGGTLTCASSARINADAHHTVTALIAYDDIASIDYFGAPTKAWYARGGKTITEALTEFANRHDEFLSKCEAFDGELLREARERGGEAYELILSAAYRLTIAAHKLIANEQGEMIWLSKENDSNGCIGTVDLSYPSSPLFLKYNPEFVRAMCRPILKFAGLPVWEYDFSPHDVGRYPHVTGQVYGLKRRHPGNGPVFPPYYLYPATGEVYDLKYQMPVEECGNMLVMLYASAAFDGNYDLVEKHLPILDKWADYLIRFGEDPGEQLCTDDFAGHLAHNVNLSAKAVVGVMCYAKILEHMNDARAEAFEAKAREMAKSLFERSSMGSYTALTFEKEGWSIKYNLVWDKLFGFDLLPESFYEAEIHSYLGRMNEFGLPLDSRKNYTKSDWIMWAAAMADDRETFEKFCQPMADYLKKTASRVPFSDWYDTVTGEYVHFIGRSVQGGLFMPLIKKV